MNSLPNASDYRLLALMALIGWVGLGAILPNPERWYSADVPLPLSAFAIAAALGGLPYLLRAARLFPTIGAFGLALDHHLIILGTLISCFWFGMMLSGGQVPYLPGNPTAILWIAATATGIGSFILLTIELEAKQR